MLRKNLYSCFSLAEPHKATLPLLANHLGINQLLSNSRELQRLLFASLSNRVSIELYTLTQSLTSMPPMIKAYICWLILLAETWPVAMDGALPTKLLCIDLQNRTLSLRRRCCWSFKIRHLHLLYLFYSLLSPYFPRLGSNTGAYIHTWALKYGLSRWGRTGFCSFIVSQASKRTVVFPQQSCWSCLSRSCFRLCTFCYSLSHCPTALLQDGLPQCPQRSRTDVTHTHTQVPPLTIIAVLNR